MLFIQVCLGKSVRSVYDIPLADCSLADSQTDRQVSEWDSIPIWVNEYVSLEIGKNNYNDQHILIKSLSPDKHTFHTLKINVGYWLKRGGNHLVHLCDLDNKSLYILESWGGEMGFYGRCILILREKNSGNLKIISDNELYADDGGDYNLTHVYTNRIAQSNNYKYLFDRWAEDNMLLTTDSIKVEEKYLDPHYIYIVKSHAHGVTNEKGDWMWDGDKPLYDIYYRKETWYEVQNDELIVLEEKEDQKYPVYLENKIIGYLYESRSENEYNDQYAAAYILDTLQIYNHPIVIQRNVTAINSPDWTFFPWYNLIIDEKKDYTRITFLNTMNSEYSLMHLKKGDGGVPYIYQYFSYNPFATTDTDSFDRCIGIASEKGCKLLNGDPPQIIFDGDFHLAPTGTNYFFPCNYSIDECIEMIESGKKN